MAVNPGYGLRINNRRVDCNLSQTELAAKLQIAQPNLSRWEREKTCPSHASFEALARALDVSWEWLKWGDQLPPVKITKIYNKYAEPLIGMRMVSYEEAMATKERNKWKRR